MSAALSIDVRVEAGDWECLGPEHLDPELRLDVFCSKVAQACLQAEEASGSFALLLTDDSALQRLNAAFRGKDAPTDVLSFPGDANDVATEHHLGDIAIAHGVSVRDAQAQNKTLQAHVSHLIIHGYLHLLGYDHMTDTQAEQMEALERRALASLGITDPYSDG